MYDPVVTRRNKDGARKGVRMKSRSKVSPSSGTEIEKKEKKKKKTMENESTTEREVAACMPFFTKFNIHGHRTLKAPHPV